MTTPAAVPTTCYPDLVSVDGRPVDIQISGSTATALANGGLTIRGCGNSSQGITLSAGTHTLTTSTAQATGLDVDALSLGSAAGGTPEALTPTGLLPAPPAHPTAPVTVVHQDRTSMTVEVHGDGQPTWLVLGQSQSRGWKAFTSGGTDLGSSTLIDGYANGWYLPAALTRGTSTFTLTWTPQRVVNVALIVSGVTLVVSVVLIALPPGFATTRRRRRRHRRRSRSRATGKAEGGATVRARVAAPVPDAGALPPGVEPDGDPVRPVLTSVVRSGGSAPGWALSLGLALVGGVVAGLIVAPAAGGLVAAVVLLELRVDRSRIVVVAATVGLLVATAGYVALHQHRNGFLSDINWPSHMGWANSLVWVAVGLLGADGLVQWVRHRRRRQPGDATGPG